MTFETFDQSDRGIKDQKNYKDKDNDKDNYIKKAPSKSDPSDL